MIIEKNNKCYRLIPNMKLGGMCDSWEEVNCTCQYCENKQTCIFAFDDYNTDGDCLADK